MLRRSGQASTAHVTASPRAVATLVARPAGCARAVCTRVDPTASGKVTCRRVEDPVLALSAFKHGLAEAEILHAYRNPIRVWDLGDGFTMVIGPNAAAVMLEIGYVQGDTAVVIVHALRAREKFLR